MTVRDDPVTVRDDPVTIRDVSRDGPVKLASSERDCGSSSVREVTAGDHGRTQLDRVTVSACSHGMSPSEMRRDFVASANVVI